MLISCPMQGHGDSEPIPEAIGAGSLSEQRAKGRARPGLAPDAGPMQPHMHNRQFRDIKTNLNCMTAGVHCESLIRNSRISKPPRYPEHLHPAPWNILFINNPNPYKGVPSSSRCVMTCVPSAFYISLQIISIQSGEAFIKKMMDSTLNPPTLNLRKILRR